MKNRSIFILAAVICCFSVHLLDAAERVDTAIWKVGVAAVDITPKEPAWTAGYGTSTLKPSEKVVLPIFAKAMVLEDTAGARMVMVTLDLIGVQRKTRDGVERKVAERYQLPPESILLNASHTHTAPALTAGGIINPAYAAKAVAYADALEDRIVEVVGQALAASGPARLHYVRARAGFAMNRRLPVGNSFGNSPYPDGPVDHDVPVLKVTAADGKLKALLFGYACHNTATGRYLVISGDYAGYAQKYLEEAHPGTIAMFMMGAGGDQNAYPRHSASLEQPAQHGRTLANAVEAGLAVVSPRPVLGPLRSAFAYVDLDFADITRADLERRARSSDAGEKKRAGELLEKLNSGAEFRTNYPCPVQVVRFGNDLLLAAIGGEITVDYSLRLKQELGGGSAAIWVAGYSNDVFGYLGSKRVIVEGGYEGYSSNLGRFPGPWAIDSEERVVRKVYELIRTVNH